MIKRARLFVTVGATLALILVISLFRSISGSSAALEQTEIVEVARGQIGHKVSATGFISPKLRVPVMVASRERVLSVKVAPGQLVHRGEVLVTLDPSRVMRDVERSRLALRRAELAVMSAALPRPCTKPHSVECLALRTQELELEETRLDLRDAQRDLAALTVRAPVEGLVVDVRVGIEGMAGDPTSPAIVLAASSEWQVEIEADEFEIRDIEIGQEVSTIVPALTESPCLGRVTSAPTVFRARLGIGAPTLFRFAAGLDCPVQPTIAGLSAHVEVETYSVSDAILVPLRALFRDQENDYVVVMRNGLPRGQRVSLGLTDASTAQILSGLHVGERVLAGDPALLRFVANGGK